MCPLGACVGLQTAPTAGTPKDSSQWLKRAKMSTAPHEPTRGPPGFTETCIQAPKGKAVVPVWEHLLRANMGKVWVCPAHLAHPHLPTVGPCGHVFWVVPQIKCASLNFQVTEALTGLSLTAVSPLGFDLSTRSCSLVFFLYFKLSRFQQLLKYRSVNERIPL